jgi:serine/threonine-protein kinase
MPTTATSAVVSAAPAVAPPPTAAAGAAPTTVPGDLMVRGRPMSKPACDGRYITIVGSSISPDHWLTDVTRALDAHPGSEYLRTDQTCGSLRPSVDGNAIYSTYFGPFGTREEACAARARGPADAYVKQLSTALGPTHQVECS